MEQQDCRPLAADADVQRGPVSGYILRAETWREDKVLRESIGRSEEEGNTKQNGGESRSLHCSAPSLIAGGHPFGESGVAWQKFSGIMLDRDTAREVGSTEPTFRRSRTMKLDGIIAFVAVADCGSINEAARQLRLSKSTVSERVTELEHALGAKLLLRNSRQFALTNDGIALLERARRIIAETSEAKEDLARRRGDVSGALRIAVPRAFGDLHLGPILYDFMARYPDITVTAEFDDRISDLGSGFDALVRIAPVELPKLAVEQLTISRRTLVAAPSYLDRHGRPETINQLEHHQAIHYMDRGPDDWTFRAEIERVVARVAPRLRVSSCFAMRDAAIAGLGIAWLPTFHSHQAVKTGALEVLDVGVDSDVTPITIAYQNGLAPPARLKAMIEHFKIAFGNPPYWDEGLIIANRTQAG